MDNKDLGSIVKKYLKEEFDPKEYYPNNHKLGMVVPKGGSSCSKCRFISRDGIKCANKGFQKWNAEYNKAKDPSALPAPADEYCCDLFETKKMG